MMQRADELYINLGEKCLPTVAIYLLPTEQLEWSFSHLGLSPVCKTCTISML